jgi:hypothetical protein
VRRTGPVVLFARSYVVSARIYSAFARACSSLHLQLFDEQWAVGQRNGTELWWRIKKGTRSAAAFRVCPNGPGVVDERNRLTGRWVARPQHGPLLGL